uniref:transposase domain-containing protein n=1 Tax=Burkholderia cepacia TaxID=292 RepID=UPI00299CDFFE|nr:transposase domain-containing protein [Burkholderia cepacia]
MLGRIRDICRHASGVEAEILLTYEPRWGLTVKIAGAHTSANLCSLVETCKANGIGPCNYLIRLLQCLPLAQTVDGYTRLLPWNMRSNPHGSTEA